MTELTILLPRIEDTHAFAKTLAGLIMGRKAPTVLALTGDLGSGKTTFTQSFATACGITEAITSPTFTLMNEYRLAEGLFVHSDLYRLTDRSEIASLGLTDYFTQPHTVTIVEWADRFPDLFPHETIWLRWRLTPGHHTVTVSTLLADRHHAQVAWLWSGLQKEYA